MKDRIITGPMSFDDAKRIIRAQTHHQPRDREAEQLRQRALETEERAITAMTAAMDDPDIGGTLVTMSFAAARTARTSPDPAAARTREVLRSLQFFERAVVPPGILPLARCYFEAGGRLTADGDADGGAILQGFAVQLFRVPGREPTPVTACRARWRERHLLNEMFPYPHPADRAGHEEQILARLLNCPDDNALRGLVTADTFTTHLRAEAWHAALGGDPSAARDRFAEAMLRAPGWALNDPDAWLGPDRARRYIDRLQSHLPAAGAQPREAAGKVAEMQQRAERDCGIVIGPGSDLTLLARRPHRAAEAGLPLKDPPPREQQVNVSIRIDDPDLADAFSHRVLEPDYPLFGHLPKPSPRAPAHVWPEPSGEPVRSGEPVSSGPPVSVGPQAASAPLASAAPRREVPYQRQAPEQHTIIAEPPPLPAPSGPAFIR